MDCPNVDISSKELHARKYFLKKSCGHIHQYLIFRPNINGYPQCMFPNDVMSENRQIVCINE